MINFRTLKSSKKWKLFFHLSFVRVLYNIKSHNNLKGHIKILQNVTGYGCVYSTIFQGRIMVRVGGGGKLVGNIATKVHQKTIRNVILGLPWRQQYLNMLIKHDPEFISLQLRHFIITWRFVNNLLDNNATNTCLIILLSLVMINYLLYNIYYHRAMYII